MLPAREARTATRGACHRVSEVCPIADMARRPTNRQRRRQSEATNPVQSEIQQVLAAEPGWTKRFQLPSPPEFQEVRTERRRSCPAVLPFRARARAWSNNRQQRTQEHSRQLPSKAQ